MRFTHTIDKYIPFRKLWPNIEKDIMVFLFIHLSMRSIYSNSWLIPMWHEILSCTENTACVEEIENYKVYLFDYFIFKGRVMMNGLVSFFKSNLPSMLWTLLCIMFKIIVFFITTLFAWLCVRVDILLTCRKRVHERIISLRAEMCAHKTSQTPPLSIEVPIPRQESERPFSDNSSHKSKMKWLDLWYLNL